MTKWTVKLLLSILLIGASLHAIGFAVVDLANTKMALGLTLAILTLVFLVSLAVTALIWLWKPTKAVGR